MAIVCNTYRKQRQHCCEEIRLLGECLPRVCYEIWTREIRCQTVLFFSGSGLVPHKSWGRVLAWVVSASANDFSKAMSLLLSSDCINPWTITVTSGGSNIAQTQWDFSPVMCLVSCHQKAWTSGDESQQTFIWSTRVHSTEVSFLHSYFHSWIGSLHRSYCQTAKAILRRARTEIAKLNGVEDSAPLNMAIPKVRFPCCATSKPRLRNTNLY